MSIGSSHDKLKAQKPYSRVVEGPFRFFFYYFENVKRNVSNIT